VTATGEKIVEIAEHAVGISEVPKGSNSGPRIEEFQHATFLAGTGWPWCAAFYCWVNKEAGIPLPYPSAGAYDLLHWAQKTGNSPKVPEPGDGVVFNIGSGHIGVLKAVKGDSVVTIDGNWGDAVAEHTSHRSLVAGYVHNPLEAHAREVAKRRLPPVVIATSVHGHRKVLFRARTKAGAIHWLEKHVLMRYGGITISRRKPVAHPKTRDAPKKRN
jgi:CHAP domain-containing protein